MKLLDDIVIAITDTKEPLADILRKCLVLAYRLNNDSLKVWVEKELNGYEKDEDLPDYRLARGISKGLFVDGLAGYSDQQPIPDALMEERHRDLATKITFTQPIASYDQREASNAAMQWSQNLVVYYQEKFLSGMYLNRAWIEIPAGLIIGLVDTVRTRVLTFALEIQSELPEDTEDALQDLPKEKVEQAVQVHIYGGQPMINLAGTIEGNVTMVGNLTVMKQELKEVGVADEDIAELDTVLEEDAKDLEPGEKPKGLGKRTLDWIGKAAKAGVKGGASMTKDVAVAVIAEIITRNMR